MFNKTISQQNKKSHNTKINDSIVYKFVYNKDKKKKFNWYLISNLARKKNSLIGYNKINWWYVCLNSKVLGYENFTI